MQLVCPTCSAAFAVDDASLSPGGVSCPVCGGVVRPRATSGSPGAVELSLDIGSAAPELEEPQLPLEGPQLSFGPDLSLDGDLALATSAGSAGSGLSLENGSELSLDTPELSLDGDPDSVAPAPLEVDTGPSPATSGILDLDESGGGAATSRSNVTLPQSTGVGSGASESPVSNQSMSTSSPRAAAQAQESSAPPSVEGSLPAATTQPSLRKTPASVRAHLRGPRALGGAAGDGTWRLGAAVAGTAVLAIGIVVAISVVRSSPPAPPKIPNPLRQQVAAWIAQGVVASVPTTEEAVRAAREGIKSGSDAGLRTAYVAARSALIKDPDSAQSIAVYGLVLAQWPDQVDDEDLNTALGAITSAIGDDPESLLRPDLERARAWLLVRSGRAEAARQAAERALALQPDSSSLRLVSAVSRLRTRPDVAATEMAALEDEADVPPDLAAWTGEAYLRSGNVKRALGVWKGALGKGPEDVAILRRLARFAVALGDFHDALSQFQQIVDRGWASVGDRLLLARLLMREGEAQAAFDVVDAGLKYKDLSALNRARLICEKVAIVTLGRGLDDSGVSGWLDEALALSPDLPELLFVAGQVDESRGAVDDAIDSLEAAFDLAPQQPHIAMLLAKLLAQREPKEARRIVATALKESPQHVPLHLMLAYLELQKGDSRAAAAAVRRAFDFDPARSAADHLEPYAPVVHVYEALAKEFAKAGRRDNPVLDTAAGAAYYFAKDFGKANAAVNRAVRSDPNEVGARLYRAIIALEKGKSTQAKRDLLAALDSDSRHRVVRFYHALVLEESKKTQSDAERIYRDLLDANPLDGAARVGLARMLAARGAVAEAQAAAVKVLVGRPNDRAAMVFLAGEPQQVKSKGKGRGKGKGKGKRRR